jgi:hypothetical protein
VVFDSVKESDDAILPGDSVLHVERWYGSLSWCRFG